MIKLAIVGSRTWDNYAFFERELNKIIAGAEVHIISGGQRSVKPTHSGNAMYFGADYFAECYARDKQIPITIYHAQWNKYGKSAGYKRNVLIVNDCEILVAFWVDRSPGTKHSIDLATRANKRVIIFDPPNMGRSTNG